MASSHHIAFFADLEVTNDNFRELLVDVNGDTLASDFNLVPSSIAYTKTVVIPSNATEFILAGTCEGCTLTATLEYSPDGENWCPCLLEDGSECTVNCTDISGDCTVKVVDVPLLQYVRIKIGPVGSESEPGNQKFCSLRLHYTLN